jgi:hypothetical protein
MKEFKEWCKDKVIAFTEGILSGQFIPDWYEANDYNWVINDAKYQEFPKLLSAEILWMYKSEYDKLDNPKDYIGKWNKIPEEFEKYCNMFNEKTRIR